MNDQDKTNEELIKELQELRQEINYLKESNNNRIAGSKATETGLKKDCTELPELIKAEEANDFAENIINTLREPLLVLDQDLRVVKASRSFYHFFKVTSGETVGKLIYDLGNNQWDIPKLRELLETVLPEKTTFDDYEVEHDFSTIGRRVMLLNARQIKRAFGKEKIILLAIEDITERKSAEESTIEKSRITTEYLEILLNHSHAPIIIWDSSLVIKRFNHEFEKLSGYKSAEVIGKKIDILFPKGKIDTTLVLLNNNLSNEDPQVTEIDLLTKDKNIKTVLWNSANIFDKEGTNIVATITQDISSRKQAEEALRISELQYRHLFENAPIGKIKTRVDDSLFVNKAFSDLLGYSIAELKKLKWQDITYPDDIIKSSEAFDALLSGKSKFVRYTKRYVHKTGAIIWADISITLIKDEEGKPLFYHTYVIDITEHKHVEAELSKTEQRYQTLFNEIDEGFCIIEMIFDKSGKPIDYRFLETNPAFEKQTGLINAQGSRMRQLAPEHEEYWFEIYGNVALTGQSIRFSQRAEQLHRFYDVYAFRIGPPENQQVAILFNDISERKKTEDALQKSEERFRQVMDNLQEGCMIIGFDWTYLYLNDSAARNGQNKRENLIGRTMTEIYPGIEKSIVFAHYRRCMERRIPENFEESYTFTDGTTTWNNFIVEPLPEGIFILALDITDRKRSEDALRDTYDKLLQAQRVAQIGSWENYLVTNDLQWSEEMYNILDFPPGTPTNLAEVAKVFAPGEFERLQQAVGKAINENSPYSIDYKIVRSDGSIKYIHDEGQVFRDEYGKAVRMFGTTQDITGRKNAEEALRKSEALQSKMVANIGDVILIVDQDGINRFKSPNIEKWFGWKPEDVVGESVWNNVHPDDLDFIQKLFISLLREPNAARTTECRYRCKDNSYKWIELTAINLLHDPEIRGILGNYHDITERIHAEEKSRESEAKYRAFFENSMDAILLTSADGRTYSANPAACSMFGYTEDELIRAGRAGVVDATDPRLSVMLAERKLNGNAQGELTFMRKDGTHFTGEISSTIFKNTDGSQRASMIIRDTTDRKNSEKALSQSEKKFRSYIDNAPDGIFVVDETGRYIDVNNAACTMSGYSENELLRMSITDLLAEESLEDGLSHFNALIQNGKSKSDLSFKHKDGNIRWWSLDAVKLTESRFLGFTKDITERKQIEDKLQESEEQFRKLYENAKIGLYRTTPEGTILMANKALVNLFGFPSFEMLASRNLEKDGFGPTYQRKEFLDMIEREGEVNNFEAEWIRMDGSKIYVQESAQAIRDSHNIIKYFDGVVEDITERKRVGEELIEAKNKAEESDRLKTAFLTNMSHEVRTPLNGILGFTSLLKEPKLTGVEQQEYIEIIEKSGERMLDIISDIISLSIVESGNLDTYIAATDVNKQIEFLFTFFKPEARQKGLEIYLSRLLPPNESVILTDEEKLNSILSNLIKNAIKFTHTGSIEFGCERKGRYLEYYVKDTGKGIEEGKTGIIFDRFRQGSEAVTRNYEGAGLGLSISKAYVELLGGKIWVESVEGEGSTFYFNIPYNTKPEKKIVKNNAVLANEPVAQPRKLKILIAEDDESSAMLLRIVLSIFSDTILTAATGVKAIEACRNNPDLDLVLMDIKMPGIDGIEATSQIRQFNKEVVIIAQTSYGQIEDKELALKAGCNEFITKPLDIAVLKALIQKQFYQ